MKRKRCKHTVMRQNWNDGIKRQEAKKEEWRIGFYRTEIENVSERKRAESDY